MFYCRGCDFNDDPSEIEVEGAIGLDFQGANGIDYHPRGKVTEKNFPADGKIYYCDCRSWPAERATIVYA